MNGAFYIGATGLQSQERALHVVANNIANLNTVGFKRSDVRFSELVGAAADPANAALGAGGALSGVSVDTAGKVFAQGELRQTGNPLDIAISGEGFIELLGPEGQTRLWRGGTLTVNADGYLAAANGLRLKAMISAPAEATAIAIGRDGKVMATVAGETEPSEVGRIELAVARDPAGLSAVGEGLYAPAEETDLLTSAPGEGGVGEIVQAALESSNVEMSEQMVALLLMQRAYAANAQIVQAGDQLMGIANGLKR